MEHEKKMKNQDIDIYPEKSKKGVVMFLKCCTECCTMAEKRDNTSHEDVCQKEHKDGLEYLSELAAEEYDKLKEVLFDGIDDEPDNELKKRLFFGDNDAVSDTTDNFNIVDIMQDGMESKDLQFKVPEKETTSYYKSLNNLVYLEKLKTDTSENKKMYGEDIVYRKNDELLRNNLENVCDGSCVMYSKNYIFEDFCDQESKKIPYHGKYVCTGRCTNKKDGKRSFCEYFCCPKSTFNSEISIKKTMIDKVNGISGYHQPSKPKTIDNDLQKQFKTIIEDKTVKDVKNRTNLYFFDSSKKPQGTSVKEFSLNITKSRLNESTLGDFYFPCNKKCGYDSLYGSEACLKMCKVNLSKGERCAKLESIRKNNYENLMNKKISPVKVFNQNNLLSYIKKSNAEDDVLYNEENSYNSRNPVIDGGGTSDDLKALEEENRPFCCFESEKSKNKMHSGFCEHDVKIKKDKFVVPKAYMRNVNITRHYSNYTIDKNGKKKGEAKESQSGNGGEYKLQKSFNKNASDSLKVYKGDDRYKKSTENSVENNQKTLILSKDSNLPYKPNIPIPAENSLTNNNLLKKDFYDRRYCETKGDSEYKDMSNTEHITVNHPSASTISPSKNNLRYPVFVHKPVSKFIQCALDILDFDDLIDHQLKRRLKFSEISNDPSIKNVYSLIIKKEGNVFGRSNYKTIEYITYKKIKKDCTIHGTDVFYECSFQNCGKLFCKKDNVINHYSVHYNN